eukprot:UN10419
MHGAKNTDYVDAVFTLSNVGSRRSEIWLKSKTHDQIVKDRKLPLHVINMIKVDDLLKRTSYDSMSCFGEKLIDHKVTSVTVGHLNMIYQAYKHGYNNVDR